MEIFSLTELMEEYSKITSKPCIYISFDKYTSIEDVAEAAPFFEDERLVDFHYLANHKGILVFDTEKEMEECFAQIVNNGTIYAVTCVDGMLTDEI